MKGVAQGRAQFPHVTADESQLAETADVKEIDRVKVRRHFGLRRRGACAAGSGTRKLGSRRRGNVWPDADRAVAHDRTMTATAMTAWVTRFMTAGRNILSPYRKAKRPESSPERHRFRGADLPTINNEETTAQSPSTTVCSGVDAQTSGTHRRRRTRHRRTHQAHARARRRSRSADRGIGRRRAQSHRRASAGSRDPRSEPAGRRRTRGLQDSAVARGHAARADHHADGAHQRGRSRVRTRTRRRRLRHQAVQPSRTQRARARRAAARRQRRRTAARRVLAASTWWRISTPSPSRWTASRCG